MNQSTIKNMNLFFTLSFHFWCLELVIHVAPMVFYIIQDNIDVDSIDNTDSIDNIDSIDKWFILYSFWPHGLHSPWNSPGQNTGMGSLSLLQGIFPTQQSNPGYPHCRRILYQLSHKGSPRTLEWIAYPFSSGSAQPRNWTRVSCIAGGFFTNWVIRQALS